MKYQIIPENDLPPIRKENTKYEINKVGDYKEYSLWEDGSLFPHASVDCIRIARNLDFPWKPEKYPIQKEPMFMEIEQYAAEETSVGGGGFYVRVSVRNTEQDLRKEVCKKYPEIFVGHSSGIYHLEKLPKTKRHNAVCFIAKLYGIPVPKTFTNTWWGVRESGSEELPFEKL